MAQAVQIQIIWMIACFTCQRLHSSPECCFWPGTTHQAVHVSKGYFEDKKTMWEYARKKATMERRKILLNAIYLKTNITPIPGLECFQLISYSLMSVESEINAGISTLCGATLSWHHLKDVAKEHENRWASVFLMWFIMNAIKLHCFLWEAPSLFMEQWNILARILIKVMTWTLWCLNHHGQFYIHYSHYPICYLWRLWSPAVVHETELVKGFHRSYQWLCESYVDE